MTVEHFSPEDGKRIEHRRDDPETTPMTLEQAGARIGQLQGDLEEASLAAENALRALAEAREEARLAKSDCETLKAAFRLEHDRANAASAAEDHLRGTLVQADERASLRDPRDREIGEICERLGYGAVMDAAARLWRRKDKDGALMVGSCLALTRAALAKSGGPR